MTEAEYKNWTDQQNAMQEEATQRETTEKEETSEYDASCGHFAEEAEEISNRITEFEANDRANAMSEEELSHTIECLKYSHRKEREEHDDDDELLQRLAAIEVAVNAKVAEAETKGKKK